MSTHFLVLRCICSFYLPTYADTSARVEHRIIQISHLELKFRMGMMNEAVCPYTGDTIPDEGLKSRTVCKWRPEAPLLFLILSPTRASFVLSKFSIDERHDLPVAYSVLMTQSSVSTQTLSIPRGALCIKAEGARRQDGYSGFYHDMNIDDPRFSAIFPEVYIRKETEEFCIHTTPSVTRHTESVVRGPCGVPISGYL
ncbi:hypothetical protein J3R30DRAFT_743708 [Lentinula aciculospora]|uniref:Uncharacterized protein n=1 Tax=Lentinula aciculospora TaxID=153920 RepID=A0A9W9A2H0_9AGAR|nr:hypothetical protein J3R30DRAFT_743708 [Lentinula aciculospora]